MGVDTKVYSRKIYNHKIIGSTEANNIQSRCVHRFPSLPFLDLLYHTGQDKEGLFQYQ